MNKKKARISAEVSSEEKERIVEDLDSVKVDNADKDGPLAVIPKDKQKEILGRSPDDGDALMMRSYFELRPPTNFSNFLA